MLYKKNAATPAYDPLARLTGDKRYELANHLGNVLSVVSDKKIPKLASGSLQYFNPDIKAYNDYYPFEGGAFKKCPVDIFSERASLPRGSSPTGTLIPVITGMASRVRKCGAFIEHL